MSEPESTVEAVEVTQDDRDAAFAYRLYTSSLKADDYRAKAWRTAIDSGERDGSELVQAFARHRLASQPAATDQAKLIDDQRAETRREALEEAAKVADSWSAADYSEECNILADSIAREIRARNGSNLNG